MAGKAATGRPKTVPCDWCGSTKLCYRHWELYGRIADEPNMARRMLTVIDKNPYPELSVAKPGEKPPAGLPETHFDADATSDAAAYRLLKRIAEKAVEPMNEGTDPNKTVGQHRREITALLMEAVDFVMTRNRTGEQ